MHKLILRRTKSNQLITNTFISELKKNNYIYSLSENWEGYTSIPLIITMLVAVFIVHRDHDFGKKELGLFYLINYLVLLLLGSGKNSVDSLIRKR